MEQAARPFPMAAAGALAPVAVGVTQVRQQAEAGGLTIDLDAATAMLRRLRLLRDRAAELVTASGGLDTPLRFGDNWVSEIIAERLRAVAVDQDGGATPVLRTFVGVLDELKRTVELAAEAYRRTDEQGADTVTRAAAPQVQE